MQDWDRSEKAMGTIGLENVEQVQTILICQHKACRKAGAAAVLAAFEVALRQVDLPKPIALRPVRCLGRCGNGPMVLILPEQVWYDHVHPDEVPNLIDRL
ncbi:(2Fe-2S) ferredoxin domain-containing protein [Egbenema bharatensis]|uniref:(2Fe-2S) ferredoxin domain-containing protein n=1 Tax=Egbenema bharatensis TaxID=3463334 RepID=UPI003A8A57DB